MRVRCSCGKQLSVQDDLLGKKVRCPTCGATTLVEAGIAEGEPVKSRARTRADEAPPSDEGEDRPKAKPRPAVEPSAPLLGICLAGVGGLVVGAAVTALLMYLFSGRSASPAPPTLPAPPTPNPEEIQILAAFYGQNVSWIDVTDKVRDKVQGKKVWATKVETGDWGEPAPDFQGPRTLLIRYSVNGTNQLKRAYQGELISLP